MVDWLYIYSFYFFALFFLGIDKIREHNIDVRNHLLILFATLYLHFLINAWNSLFMWDVFLNFSLFLNILNIFAVFFFYFNSLVWL
jgi:hypothetical protein